MNELRHWFANPWMLFALAFLPNLVTLALMAARRRRKVLPRLGRIPALMGLVAAPRLVRLLRGLCLLGGLACLAVASAGPHWGRDPRLTTAPGRDLVVVLDLSRSMFAEDVLPSRLERAKEALRELADAVERRGGHRLALVVFAARPTVVCPLTHDYDHFREKLQEIDGEHLPAATRPTVHGPTSGTRIGAGLSLAIAQHDVRFRGYQDVLLLSDGDDPGGDREWLLGVQEARNASIAISTVGIGDPERGGRIPQGGAYLRHEETEIWTRLQEVPLEEIAARTGGVYLAARTDPPRLPEWYRTTVETQERRDSGDDPLPTYQQRNTWFFLPALGLLILAIAVPERLHWRQRLPTA